MTLTALQRTCVAALIVVLATTSVLAQSPPQAQAPAPSGGQPQSGQPQGEEGIRARAKQLFEGAVVDYDAGRYAPALAGFQEAFRIRPHPLVRVNMANCYDKLGKPLQAIFHFEQFLQADVGTPEQRKEVTTAIARLKKQVGEVLLHIAPDGATVIIDGGEQRRAPVIDAVRLPIGKHAVEVQLEGYKTVRRDFVIEAGATLELNVALEPGSVTAVAPVAVPQAAPQKPTPAAPVAPTPPVSDEVPTLHASETPAEPEKSPEPEPSRSSRGPLPTRVWIAGGVSAALLIAGTVTGVVALGAQSDFEEQNDQYRALVMAPAGSYTPLQRQVVYDNAVSSADRANNLALATDILLGGALVGAAVTTVLVIMHLNESDPPQVSATLTQKSAGVQWRASF